jgi:hypothetical protein
MHPRRTILEHIGNLYKAVPQFSRVINQRTQPKIQSWPTVTFFDEDETVSPLTINAYGDTDRDMGITTVIWTQASADPEKIESDLDYYCWLAEQSMPQDIREIKVIDIKLVSTFKEAPEYDDNGQQIRLATASLTHRIRYITCQDQP